MYTAQTKSQILSELKNYYTGGESLVEGNFSYDIFSANAIEFAKLELELADAYQAAFGTTAWNEYLDMKAAEHGIYRREATFAHGEVEVTGTGLIKTGALFATADNIQFAAVTDTAIVESGTVEVICTTVGEIGNVESGTITKIPLNIAGILSVNNSSAMVDGYDEESDEDLRDRYLTAVRYPATSGNPQHYTQWSLEISGVGAASCLRCWNGRGTVKVVIVDSHLQSPSDELIQQVYDHIESLRPIGVELTVAAAIPVTVNVSAEITGTVDIERFRAECLTYFKRLMLLRFIDYTSITSYEVASEVPAGSVSRAILGELILKSGATDYNYDTLKINDLAEDIALNIEQIPQLGSLSFTIKG